jgi:protein-tyrosine kinase
VDSLGKISEALDKYKSEKIINLERFEPEGPEEPVEPEERKGPEKFFAEDPEVTLARKIRPEYKFSERLVTLSAPDSFDAENFKVLRGQILFPRDREVPHTILVTSAFPGEGKTFVASNLATALALSVDDYVLLIDADLRRASIHQMFGFSNARGLQEYLTGRKGLDDLLVKTGIEKLTVLPAGKKPRNPGELLSSNMMAQFLKEAKESYKNHFIIIDSPPSHITAEAKFLSKHVDAVIFVVMAQRTPRNAVERAIDNLGRDKVIGVVFNGYDKAHNGYSKYYDHYYKKGQNQ